MKLTQEIIQSRLKEIEKNHHVRILYACESGSRAWGFESQDSDYDIRFLYVRNVEDYIAVEAPRDVLEIPTDEVWDINGWDLAKALKLLVKGNSNLLEWLHSPIQYIENPQLCQSLLELAKSSVSFKKLFYSYQGMARNNYREYLKGDEVWIKKYLYVLRPLLACLWIEHHQDLPPVQFEKLVDYASKEFLMQKGTDLKFGARPLRRAIQRYLEDEISEMILRSELQNGQTIHVTFDHNQNKLQFTAES